MLRVDGLRTCNVLSDSGGARFEDTCVNCADSIVGDLQRRCMGGVVSGWSGGSMAVVWGGLGVCLGVVWGSSGGGMGSPGGGLGVV